MRHSRQAFASVDRSLGQLISFTGVMLLITQAFYVFETAAPVQTWWRVLSLIAPTLMVIAGVFGRRLPLSVLTGLWIAIPVIGFLTTLLSFPAYTGSTPESFLSWEWRLAGPYLSFMALWLPANWAIGAGVVLGLFPALSGFLRYGHVPAAVGELIPIALSNFAFAVLFIGIRAGMNRFHAARLRAAEAEAWSAQAQAQAEAQARFSLVVHDSVLASLCAALHLTGEPPAELRAAAHSALTTLEDHMRPQPERGATVPVSSLTETLALLRERAGWGGDTRVEPRAGELPREAADAILGATAEALRNAQQHAGPGGAGEISAEIGARSMTVTIRDRGRGFDPGTIARERLGIRGSILGRMAAVSGGSAAISSAPGGGTEVRVQWTS